VDEMRLFSSPAESYLYFTSGGVSLQSNSIFFSSDLFVK